MQRSREPDAATSPAGRALPPAEALRAGSLVFRIPSDPAARACLNWWEWWSFVAGADDGAPLIVRAIAAGRHCTVAGLWLDPVSSWVGVEACAGVVTLRSVSAGPNAGIPMQVLHARSVIVEACQIESARGAALTVNASAVYCVDCIIRGLDVWPPAMGRKARESSRRARILDAVATFVASWAWRPRRYCPSRPSMPARA